MSKDNRLNPIAHAVDKTRYELVKLYCTNGKPGLGVKVAKNIRNESVKDAALTKLIEYDLGAMSYERMIRNVNTIKGSEL